MAGRAARCRGAAPWIVGAGALGLWGCQAVLDADFSVTEVECSLLKAPERPAPQSPPDRRNQDPLAINGKPSREGWGVDSWQGTFAATKVDIGEVPALESGAHRTVGLDLDGACTGEAQGPTCALPEWLGRPPVLDDLGQGGVDNGISYLLRTQKVLVALNTFSSEEFGEGIASGLHAPPLLLRFRGHNGTNLDDQVTVEVGLSGAVTMADAQYVQLSDPGRASYQDEDKLAVVPLRTCSSDFRGDACTEDEAASEDGPALWRDDEAYIRGATVTAHFPSLALRLMNAPVRLERVTLQMVTPKGIRVPPTKVTVSGIIPMTELFRIFPTIGQATTGTLVCTDDASYRVTKRFLCQASDIRLDGATDPQRLCDGISVGMELDLAQVRWDESPLPIEAPDPRMVCPPELDPGRDTCAVPETTLRNL